MMPFQGFMNVPLIPLPQELNQQNPNSHGHKSFQNPSQKSPPRGYEIYTPQWPCGQLGIGKKKFPTGNRRPPSISNHRRENPSQPVRQHLSDDL